MIFIYWPFSWKVYQIMEEQEEKMGRAWAVSSKDEEEHQGQHGECTDNNVCKGKEPAMCGINDSKGQEMAK